ncbi:glycoside hydrolase family 2 protein [Candidatus Bathyarchaeota archaeon]|nr:MAG: glycoside hydrolase family 2 protein [Candidatus Bathyarchaeota archaeon]
MGKTEISLNGSWRLKGFPKLDGEAQGAYKPEFPVDDWLSARVPGVVHLDLMANDVIPDPFRDSNEKAVRWVDDVEWWYRKDLDLSGDVLEREVVELVFEGLDTFATVWVNGVKVGETCNMFTPYRFDVKDHLRPGRNTVVVRFKPAKKVAEELQEKYRELQEKYWFPPRSYLRKAQYSFGWDWGPTLPTAGIWRGVKLVAYDRARLGYLALIPIEVTENEAEVKLSAEVYSSERANVRVRFSLRNGEEGVEKWVECVVEPGRNDVECTVKVERPKLWWPRGYGPQNLYRLSAELYLEDHLYDKAETKVGIRSVELVQEPDEEGKTFIFRINGKLVFCKGTNWIPADSFLPRVTEHRYRRLLELAAKAEMNMLRVWGGGIYEDDVFYDLCDELGIMVWQDFMYACAEYPEEDWFLKEAEREAEEVLRRLRRHPCIVLWCGNNENQWLGRYYVARRGGGKLSGLKIYDEILPRLCKRLVPTTPYWPSSPYGGADPNSESEGDRHNWEVWSGWQDYHHYLRDRGRFLSEFGWQAPPTLEHFKEYVSVENLSPQSRVVEAHEKQEEGLERLYRFLAAHYPVTDNFELFTLYCQLNQGEALKTAVQHWRSRMFKTSGCLIWQLNDCWPVISWSLIDYGLNPKPAYYFVKRAFKSVIASLMIVRPRSPFAEGKPLARVYVVNETDKELKAFLRFYVMNFYGEILRSEQFNVSVPPYTSQLVLEREIDKLPLIDDGVLAVTLEKEGEVVSEDCRTLLEPKHLKLPRPSIKVEAVKLCERKFEVRLESDVYAKAVWLKLEGVGAEYEDNFFDLLPKRLKTVRVAVEEDLSLEEFRDKLEIRCYPYR